MLKRLLGAIWRGAPRSVRRWGVWLAQPRFSVTVGAVVTDDQKRVLLLKHVFRPGSGWGIPGGFINKRENPEEALRRELMEEVGLEIECVRPAFARTLGSLDQVEIIFRCSPKGKPAPNSVEIAKLDWFHLDALPHGLSSDQRGLIERALDE